MKRNIEQDVLSGNCNVRYRTEQSSTVLLKCWFGKSWTGPLEKTADCRKRRYLMSQVQKLQSINKPVMPTKLNLKHEKDGGNNHLDLHLIFYICICCPI